MQPIADISPAINLLLSYNRAFQMHGNFTLIQTWINQGASLEHDIMPVLIELTGKKKDITSVAYFGPSVIMRMNNRLLAEKAKANSSAIPDSSNIETLRRYAARGIYLTPAQRELLNQERISS